MFPVRGHRPALSPVACFRTWGWYRTANQRDVARLQSRCLGQKMSILFWALSGQKFLEADVRNSVIMLNSSRLRKWKHPETRQEPERPRQEEREPGCSYSLRGLKGREATVQVHSTVKAGPAPHLAGKARPSGLDILQSLQIWVPASSEH